LRSGCYPLFPLLIISATLSFTASAGFANNEYRAAIADDTFPRLITLKFLRHKNARRPKTPDTVVIN
jgi:hypothetical protein